MQYLYSLKILKISFLLLGLLFFQNARAQTGASCATAEVVNIVPYTAVGRTTCTSGDNFTNKMACANTYMNAKEYVFTYTPTGFLNSCISLSASGGTDIKGLFIVEDCPNITGTACVAQAVDVSGTASLNNIELTVGKKYYIIVSSPSICFTFTLAITAGVCSGAPTSNCATADVIPAAGPFPYASTATTCSGGKDYNQGNQPNSTYMSGEDYVYTFTPPANDCYGVALTNTGNNVGVFVFNGCPDDPKTVCIASNITTASNPIIPYMALTGGRKYYIVVSSLGSATPCTPFTMTLSKATCGGVGSTCLNPRVITSLPFNQAGLTTCGAKKDYTNVMLCNSSSNGSEDYVFTYTPSANECVLMRIPTFFGSGGMYVLTGCPNEYNTTCVAKSDVGTGSPSLTANLIGGTTYYIVVARNFGCGTFTFSMQALPVNQPGTNCANPIAVTSLPFVRTGLSTACFGNDYTAANTCGTAFMNGEDMVFSYTASGPETIGIRLRNTTTNRVGVFVVRGCPDQPGSVCEALRTSTTGNPVICTANLPVAGTYYIIVDTDAGAVGFSPGFTYTGFDIEITKTGGGGTCANPYVIPSLPFNATSLNTACYGNEYTSAHACNSIYMSGEDFVFRYDATGVECIDISLTNLRSYVGLFVLDGCPNAAGTTCITQINCQTLASCSGGLRLMTTLPAAGDYYIVVDTWFGTTTFDIDIKSGLTSAPTANFKADVPDACVGQQVTFVDTTVPCATSWSWSFPGGIPSSSTSCCPIITYPTSGRYSVTLTACNPMGCNTTTKINYVNVK
jgi:hypothetical protein